MRRHSARQTRGQSSQSPSVLMPCQIRDPLRNNYRACSFVEDPPFALIRPA